MGAGIIGLSIAWRLAQHGWRVTIFERRRAASEASWAGAGMLAPGGELHTESPILEPALQSLRLYPDFISELSKASGLEIDFQTRGGLELALSSEELEGLHYKGETQAAFGILSKPLSPDRILAFWPHLTRTGIAGGRFYPEDAIVDPRHVSAALLRSCRMLSVEICEESSVERLVSSRNVVTVHHCSGIRHFSAAVIAAGAWSSEILVENLPHLPSVEPVKGVLLGYQQPDQTCPTILRHGGYYLLQRANGLLIAGSSEERVGFDRSLPESLVRRIAVGAASLLPHLAETTPNAVWMGFRPFSPVLHVGPWHSERLYLSYGHYRNGILLAPWTADYISRHVNANLGKP